LLKATSWKNKKTLGLETLHRMPDSSFLEYKTIEGGVTGGSRGELTLEYDGRKTSPGMRSNDQNQQEEHLQLVEMALSLAASITRINVGELQALNLPMEKEE
jgi:hypothetical protein